MKLFKGQAGLIPIILLYVAIAGVVFYILIASILPLANKRLIIFHPKPESKAVNHPILHNPLPAVRFDEEVAEKKAGCDVFCQLGNLVIGFNKILEQRMEKLLLNIGLIRN